MKRIICVIITAAIMLTFASCGNNSEKKPKADSTPSVSQSEETAYADIDLTKLSTTMVYSQLIIW